MSSETAKHIILTYVDYPSMERDAIKLCTQSNHDCLYLCYWARQITDFVQKEITIKLIIYLLNKL